MTANEKKQLMTMACKVRMGVIKSTHAAKAGHPGGSLSAADVFTYLYAKELKDRYTVLWLATALGVDRVSL